MRPNADAKAIRLEAALDSNLGPIDGDPERLQQVVWNLLSNALKCTPEGGRLEITLERQDRLARIAVSDTGRGMSKTELDKAFDDFYTTKQGGTGLGLSIVRRLVLDSNGSLKVETEPGEGSRFIVEIPAQ